MEKRLNISERWLPGSEEWKAAMVKVSMRQYQRCLDTLEGLVVARMFELTKMNMSQTGELLIYCIYNFFHIVIRLQPPEAHRQCLEITINSYPNGCSQVQHCCS
jgi:hypothetical protein